MYWTNKNTGQRIRAGYDTDKYVNDENWLPNLTEEEAQKYIPVVSAEDIALLEKETLIQNEMNDILREQAEARLIEKGLIQE